MKVADPHGICWERLAQPEAIAEGTLPGGAVVDDVHHANDNLPVLEEGTVPVVDLDGEHTLCMQNLDRLGIDLLARTQ